MHCRSDKRFDFKAEERKRNTETAKQEWKKMYTSNTYIGVFCFRFRRSLVKATYWHGGKVYLLVWNDYMRKQETMVLELYSKYISIHRGLVPSVHTQKHSQTQTLPLILLLFSILFRCWCWCCCVASSSFLTSTLSLLCTSFTDSI